MLWFIPGLIALIFGAELLVRGGARLALSFGISPLVVGLTVVAFGTSAPELAVSVQAAWSGRVDIGLGNVVGSNIVNILLILGVSALITPLIVHQQLVRQEVPLMIGLSFLVWGMALDGGIRRGEGILLVTILVAYTVFLIRQSRRETAADIREEYDEAIAGEGWPIERHAWGQIVLVLGGIALLVLGSTWLVEAAVTFARWAGMSELVVGLTVVAVGTSLPEIATSILAAIRGQRDIAVGNVVGSNIFNILAVLGVAASVAPAELTVSPAMLAFDLPVMVAVAVACLPIFFTGYLIARWEGALFLGYYLVYTAYLLMDASGDAATGGLGRVMIWFVLPLTAITLVVLAGRAWHAQHQARSLNAAGDGE